MPKHGGFFFKANLSLMLHLPFMIRIPTDFGETIPQTWINLPLSQISMGKIFSIKQCLISIQNHLTKTSLHSDPFSLASLTQIHCTWPKDTPSSIYDHLTDLPSPEGRIMFQSQLTIGPPETFSHLAKRASSILSPQKHDTAFYTRSINSNPSWVVQDMKITVI